VLGLGALVRYDGDPGLRRAVSGFLGLAVLALGAIVANFFVPVGALTSLALWTIGVVAFVARRRWLAGGLTWYELLGALLAVPWLVYWLQAPTALFDSGFYYLQTIKWTAEHPVQLGLANLFSRLGYNSTWHTLAAAVQLPLLRGAGPTFLNLVPMLLAADAAAVGLARIISGPALFKDVFLALLLPVVGHAVGGLGVASADHAVSLLLAMVFALWIRALEVDDAGFLAEARPALLLSAFAITVKISAAPILLLGGVALWLRRRTVDRRWLGATAALATLLVAPWSVRSVLISGCIAFPAPWTCTSLPWSLGKGGAEVELSWVKSWARTPEVQAYPVALQDWSWLAGWAGRMRGLPDVRRFVGLAGCGLALAAIARRVTAAVALPIAVAITAVAYLFFAAPEPRFGYGFLHAVGLLPLGWGLSRVHWLQRPWARPMVALAIVALSASWAGAVGTRRWGGGWLAFPAQETTPTRPQVTASGVTVNVPLTGACCWAEPLPCTPYFNPALQRTKRGFSFQP
jgi:hypothetical protein